MAIKYKTQRPAPGHKQHQENRASWSTAFQNDLPDSSFAVIEPGGEKDASGKTTPRSLRHLPYRDANGKVDLPHLRNALARLDQTDLSDELKAAARKKLEAAAKDKGVGDYGSGENTSENRAQEQPMSPEDVAAQHAAILDMFRADPQLRAEVTALLVRAEDESDDYGEDEEEEPGEEEEEPEETTTPAETHLQPETRSATATAPTPKQLPSFYTDITRINDTKREIEGVLSDEQIDTYGTVFDYDAMKRAVARWPGNIREQHDLKKAVGRRVDVHFDDEHRKVILRARISRGAEDTWQKIQDGVLTGFSVGVSRYAPPTQRTMGNKMVPVYTDFDLGEASVVDAPSNPGAAASGLTIYRAADGFSDPAFADVDEEVTAPAAEAQPATPLASEPLAAERATEATPAPSPIMPFSGLAGLTPPPVGPLAQAAGMTAPGPGLLAQAVAGAAQNRAITTGTGLEGHDPNTGGPAADEPEATPPAETLVRADGSHAPMKGKHKHAHPAYGAQGEDATHEHEHEHDGDADHAHEHEEMTRAVAPTLTRDGQRLSGQSRSSLHDTIMSLAHLCGGDDGEECGHCKAILMVLDPDMDGDDDLDESLDTDNDDGMGLMNRVQQRLLIRRATDTAITRALAPVLRRFQGLAAQLATAPDLSRVFSELSEQRAVLTAVEGLTRKIAAQEKPGGPVLRAADKTLAIGTDAVHDASAAPNTAFQPTDIAALVRMARDGQLTPEQQSAAAGAIFRQQYGR